MRVILCTFILLLNGIICFAQTEPDVIVISTYYPSPYGSYNELRSKRLAIGDNYSSNGLYCWLGTCTTTIPANADLVVEGKVGIGTVSTDATSALTINSKITGVAPAFPSSMVIGSPTDPSFMLMGQSSQHYVTFRWMPDAPGGHADIFTDGQRPLSLNYAGGNVGIGTADPGANKLYVASNNFEGIRVAIASDPNRGIGLIRGPGNSDGISTTNYNGGLESWWGIGFRCKWDSGVRHMFDTRTGNSYSTPGGPFTALSDKRIKKDITPFTDGLNILTKLNPVNFKYNGKAGWPNDFASIGLIAQDVKNLIPYSISTIKAKLDPEDKEETDILGVNAGPLTFVMINAIKEQQNEINLLKKEIEAIKEQLNSKE